MPLLIMSLCARAINGTREQRSRKSTCLSYLKYFVSKSLVLSLWNTTREFIPFFPLVGCFFCVRVCVCFVLFCFLIFTPMGTSKLLLYAEGELGSVPNIATSDITTKWNSFATYIYRRPYFSEFDNSFFCRNIARPLAEWISETIEWRGHSSF